MTEPHTRLYRIKNSTTISKVPRPNPPPSYPELLVCWTAEEEYMEWGRLGNTTVSHCTSTNNSSVRSTITKEKVNLPFESAPPPWKRSTKLPRRDRSVGPHISSPRAPTIIDGTREDGPLFLMTQALYKTWELDNQKKIRLKRVLLRDC